MIDTPAILHGEDRINNLPKAMALAMDDPLLSKKTTLDILALGMMHGPLKSKIYLT
jgi:hypothetical protein